jgi:hypothetical protein
MTSDLAGRVRKSVRHRSIRRGKQQDGRVYRACGKDEDVPGDTHRLALSFDDDPLDPPSRRIGLLLARLGEAISEHAVLQFENRP